MNRVPRESRSLPYQAAFLGQQGRHLSADQLVAYRLVAVGIDLVRVCNLPRPASAAVVVGHGLLRGSVLCPMRIKGVAVLVLGASHLSCSAPSIDLEYCVFWSVDVWVYSHAEQMLVVVGVDAGIDFRAPSVGILAVVHRVGIQDSSELDLKLYCAVLMEDPVHAVFVISGRKDMGYYQLPPTGHDDRIITEVGVFEEYTGILLVDTNCVLDDLTRSGTINKCCVHVMDGTLAVAAKGKTVSHVSAAVLAEIKGMLPVMRMLRIPVWDHHLCQRETIEDTSLIALVVVRDVIQDDSFPIIESYVNLPVLPTDGSSIHVERNALGLSDVDGLQILPISTLGFDCSWMVVVRWSLIDRASYGRYVNVHNFLRVGVENWGKVKRIRVLAVVNVWAIVHECLLKPHFVPESFIVPNRPCYPNFSTSIAMSSVLTVAVDFVHVLLGYSENATLLNDLWIYTHNMLDDLEIFHCDLRKDELEPCLEACSYQRLNSFYRLPL